MTRVTVTRRDGSIVAVSAEGHSGYADSGSDIVCAGITACFRLLSAQLDASDIDYSADVDEARAFLSIAAHCAAASPLFAGFAALMGELADEFPKNISITEVEQNA